MGLQKQRTQQETWGGSGEGNAFVFEQAVFEMLTGYRAGDVYFKSFQEWKPNIYRRDGKRQRSLSGQVGASQGSLWG